MTLFELRFPRAGRWAVSIMDLDGTFRDFGLRRVRPAGSEEQHGAEKAGTASSESEPLLALGAGIASLGLTAGLALSVRRRRHGWR